MTIYLQVFIIVIISTIIIVVLVGNYSYTSLIVMVIIATMLVIRIHSNAIFIVAAAATTTTTTTTTTTVAAVAMTSILIIVIRLAVLVIYSGARWLSNSGGNVLPDDVAAGPYKTLGKAHSRADRTCSEVARASVPCSRFTVQGFGPDSKSSPGMCCPTPVTWAGNYCT